MRAFYAAAAVVGTVVPWVFFGSYLASGGLSLAGAVGDLFANGAAGGFVADVLISIGVFLVWSAVDARRHRVPRWWLVLPATGLVGLSLSLPLYLFLREGAVVGAAPLERPVGSSSIPRSS